MKFEAPTLMQALESAAREFGCALLEVEYDVIEPARAGFLGIGRKNAVIEARFTPKVEAGAADKGDKFEFEKNAVSGGGGGEKKPSQNLQNLQNQNPRGAKISAKNAAKDSEVDECFGNWLKDFENESLEPKKPAKNGEDLGANGANGANDAKNSAPKGAKQAKNGANSNLDKKRDDFSKPAAPNRHKLQTTAQDLAQNEAAQNVAAPKQTPAAPLSKREQKRQRYKERMERIAQANKFVLDEYGYFEEVAEAEPQGANSNLAGGKKRVAAEFKPSKDYGKLNLNAQIFDSFYKETTGASSAAQTAQNGENPAQSAAQNSGNVAEISPQNQAQSAAQNAENQAAQPQKPAPKPAPKPAAKPAPKQKQRRTFEINVAECEMAVREGLGELLAACQYNVAVEKIEFDFAQDKVGGKICVTLGGEHAALLIGSGGRRFEALHTLLQNWFVIKFGLAAQLEIGEYFAKKRADIAPYIDEVAARMASEAAFCTRGLDATSQRIVIDELRARFPHKFIAPKDENGARVVQIKDFAHNKQRR